MTIKRNYVVKFGTNGVLFAEVVRDLFCAMVSIAIPDEFLTLVWVGP